MPNVHDDDEETLEFADESEWMDEGGPERQPPSLTEISYRHADGETTGEKLDALIREWGEQVGFYAARAQRLGDCRAGEVAAAEAGTLRNCVSALQEALRS